MITPAALPAFVPDWDYIVVRVDAWTFSAGTRCQARARRMTSRSHPLPHRVPCTAQARPPKLTQAVRLFFSRVYAAPPPMGITSSLIN